MISLILLSGTKNQPRISRQGAASESPGLEVGGSKEKQQQRVSGSWSSDGNGIVRRWEGIEWRMSGRLVELVVVI